MIKSVGLALAFALTSIASPIAASAASPGAMIVTPYLHQARVGGYACTARSRVAYGYWKGAPTRAAAKLGALRECAVRTPRGLLCVITACT